MKPSDSFVFLEPCELFAHVSAGVGLNLSNCFLTRNQSVEIGKQLLVAYCVEGIEVTLGKYIPRLLFQPLFYHQPYTTVDAVVEFFALPVKANLHDMEGSLFAAVGAE